MAEGGRKALKVDLAVSVTGNAGPTTCPGYGEVGDYFIGIVYRNKGYTFYKKGQGQRNEIRAQAVESMVIPDKVSDADAVVMAQQLREKIENEMTYPGQIKVSVIREYRATETAK